MAATGMETTWDVPNDLDPMPWGRFVDVATEIPEEATTVAGRNRAGLGVKYLPHSCDPLWTGNLDCSPTEGVISFDGDVTVGKDNVLNGFPDIVTQPAFKVLDGLVCSSLSRDRAFLDDRVEMRMRLLASAALAREAVLGRASGGEGFDSNADILTPGSSITQTFFVLEEAMADRLNGVRGTVHMSPGMLHVAREKGYVDLMGSELVTTTGHRVIADAGYRDMPRPSTGVSAGSSTNAWVYGTGPVHYQLRLGGLLDPSPNQESMELSRNIFEAYAEATAVIAFNPCAVVAVLVPIP